MNRREFIGTTAVAAAALPGGRALEAAPKENPNIIIIMADDLGYGDLSCYGSKSINTPNIDRLANEGVKLTSFFSSGPVCSPSRAGLLTGRYPARSGVHFVFVPTELLPLAVAVYSNYRMPWGLPRKEITLADALKPAGYATCCIGKWHLGDLPGYRPNSRGFDHYLGVLHSNDAFPLRLYRNNEVVEKAPVDQDYLTRKYTKEALGWIDDNHDRPFFLYMAHTFPHIPLHASPEFRGRSRAGLYGDCIEELDWSTGEIMKALEKHGIADNTFIFFTSDNGPWFQGNPGPLRGRKGQEFDGGMRVPAIARFPGAIPAGTETNEMSMNFDLFTTALAVAGISPPDDRIIDGKNILPMLRGEAVSPHQYLMFYRFKKPMAVRSARWKYHRRHTGWANLSFYYRRGPMLFNLDEDPNESYNVIGVYPDVAVRMEGLLDRWEKEFVKGVPKRRAKI